MKPKKQKIKISRSYKGRNYRRVWVHGYYRHVYILTYKNNKEVRVKVRRWVEPHWRKRTIKKPKRKSAKRWRI